MCVAGTLFYTHYELGTSSSASAWIRANEMEWNENTTRITVIK